MSGQASIDGLRFARERRQLEGTIAIAELPRLDELLLDRAGDVSYVLRGAVDRHGKPVLELSLSATLVLACQRCLGRLEYRLARDVTLVLFADDERLPDVGGEDPACEAIAASEVSEVGDIVEQEIILGLPIAPLHEAGACTPDHAEHASQPESPFAVLERLKMP